MNLQEAVMTHQSKISDALGIAVQMEQEGQRFYAEAAEKMTHPFGRRMFLSLAKDEQRHERVFRQMAREEGVRPGEMDEINQEGPIKRIRAIFREAAKDAISPGADDVEAIKAAMKLEEAAYQFYSETAESSDNATERSVLEKIALEENEHFRILDDTLLYLTDPAEWNIKEEKPLIDGG